MTTIGLRLEVIGYDRILVPGCEGTSAITSTTLLRQDPSRRATARLNAALAAIPGSKVEYQINTGGVLGTRRKWFVLPPTPIGQKPPDYYAILRSISEPEEEDTSETPEQPCLAQNGEPPPVKQYRPEGANNIPYSGLMRARQFQPEYSGPQTEDGTPLLPVVL